MMMNATAQIAAQAVQQAVRPQPELGRLKAAAERVSVASWKVQTFLDNFHGQSPETAQATDPSQDCYRNDLDSLFDAIGTLEARVETLAHIG